MRQSYVLAGLFAAVVGCAKAKTGGSDPDGGNGVDGIPSEIAVISCKVPKVRWRSDRNSRRSGPPGSSVPALPAQGHAAAELHAGHAHDLARHQEQRRVAVDVD